MSAESEDIHAQKSVCGDLACRCTVMKTKRLGYEIDENGTISNREKVKGTLDLK